MGMSLQGWRSSPLVRPCWYGHRPMVAGCTGTRCGLRLHRGTGRRATVELTLPGTDHSPGGAARTFVPTRAGQPGRRRIGGGGERPARRAEPACLGRGGHRCQHTASDGRIVWAFGDTLRSGMTPGIVANSILVSGGHCASQLLPAQDGPVIPDAAPGTVYWPMSTLSWADGDQDRLLVLCSRIFRGDPR